MSSLTVVKCDECGAVIPDGAPYLTVETMRVAVAVRGDACGSACAAAIVQRLGTLAARGEKR